MNVFFGRHTKKGLYDLCEGKFVGKSRTNLGKFGKKFSHPPKFACSYTYGL